MPRILIADDNKEMLDTLARIFGLYDFDVLKAINGQEALEQAEKYIPDIIILDGAMPVMDGFEACQQLKRMEKTKEIPVVFLTANFMELRDRIKGLELGADDYLLKPFNSKELVARIKIILNRTEQSKKLKLNNQKLVSQNSIIQQELQRLLVKQGINDSSFVTDPVTGLYTFDFFKERAEYELERSKRFNNDMSLILITFQRFEKIKEILGAQLFNYIVIKIANFILNKIRVIDLFSFDENNGFFILLPQTDESGALKKAEQIHTALSNSEYFDDAIMKSLEFSKKKLADIIKLVFIYGVVSLNNKKRIDEIDILFQSAEHDMNHRF